MGSIDHVGICFTERPVNDHRDGKVHRTHKRRISCPVFLTKSNSSSLTDLLFALVAASVVEGEAHESLHCLPLHPLRTEYVPLPAPWLALCYWVVSHCMRTDLQASVISYPSYCHKKGTSLSMCGLFWYDEGGLKRHVFCEIVG